MEQLKPPVVIVARTESSLGSVHGANGVELKGRLGSRILRRRLLQAGVFVAVWTVIAIAGSVHCYFSYASLGDPMSWPRAFASACLFGTPGRFFLPSFTNGLVSWRF